MTTLLPRPRVIFSLPRGGHLTLADARLALTSWLLAKKGGGTLVVRLEGSSSGVDQRLYEDLQWLGLQADEGPGLGGALGPYCQAERAELYTRYLDKLLHEQSAFHCFCVPQWAQATDSVPPHCTAECFRLSEQRVEELIRNGSPFFVRLKGHAGEIIFADLLRGPLALRAESAGDTILAMPNGAPSACFRAAIDDALMMITHAVRDESALPSTLSQVLICRALELEAPRVGHLPPVRATTAYWAAAEQPQLTVEQLRCDGYFPGTVLSFLARLAGISIGDVHLRTASELVPHFRIEELSKYEAVLDLQVLRKESQRQLRALSAEELRNALQPYLGRLGFAENDPRLPQLVNLYRDWAFSVGDLAQKLSVFAYRGVPVMDKAAVQYLARDSSQKVLWSLVRQARSLRHLDEQVFSRLMVAVRQETGLMGRDLWTPVRLALTGQQEGPSLPQVVALMGRERCQKLLERSLG